MMDMELYVQHTLRAREVEFRAPGYSHRADWAKGVAALRGRVRREPRGRWSGRPDRQREPIYFPY